MLSYEELIQAIPNALHTVDLAEYGTKYTGKVRDIYMRDQNRVMITTDRVSAFDRVLGVIPFKGQVLNQLSAWWFEQTSDIIENHIIAVPDPNITIVRQAEPLPIEVVVRGYITGVTSTSLWTLYEQGERQPYGVSLPEGLQKNDRLPMPIITPTTKAAAGAHDERLTSDEIVQRGLIPAELWAQIEEVAYALFARGQVVAQWANLIMVDTKYEFGLIDGRLVLIDEVHTPDSSRFWSGASYQAQRSPEHFDKEYLRMWLAERGYRGEGAPPPLTDECMVQLATRYITIYEQVTGEPFKPGAQPAATRIARSMKKLFGGTRIPTDMLSG